MSKVGTTIKRCSLLRSEYIIYKILINTYLFNEIFATEANNDVLLFNNILSYTPNFSFEYQSSTIEDIYLNKTLTKNNLEK